MRKAEQRLWDTMRRHAPIGAWAQRIENLLGEGMPDVFVAPASWVELKAPHRPARPGRTPLLGNAEGLRTAQINWHIRASQAGIRSYILIRDDTGALFLIPGYHATGLNKWVIEKVEEASVANHWEGIWEVITG